MIESKRIILRRFKSSDLHELLEMLKDEKVMAYTGFREVQTDLQSKVLLDKWIEDSEVWAIVHRTEFHLVGWIMLKKTTLEYPEIGFMLSRRFWSKGLATEAAKALIQFGKASLKVQKIVAVTDETNIPSQRVLEKIGMKKVTLKKENNESSLFYELNL